MSTWSSKLWTKTMHCQTFGILRVIMEKSYRLGRTIYCYFVDFKKAFDIVAKSEIWKKRM